MPERIKSCLSGLSDQYDGFPVNQLQHGLQTATRAQRDGASEELIVAALCHDIGKSISIDNHAAISAEILRPYVSEDTYQIVRCHQEFQGRHYYKVFGKDPDARWNFRHKRWYRQACQFADYWDQNSFDPDYETLPLSYFEPMIERVFARPRPESWQRMGRLNTWARIGRKLWRLLRFKG